MNIESMNPSSPEKVSESGESSVEMYEMSIEDIKESINTQINLLQNNTKNDPEVLKTIKNLVERLAQLQ